MGQFRHPPHGSNIVKPVMGFRKNSRQIFGVLSALWILALFFLHRSSGNGFIQQRLIQPIEFNVRQWLGKTPPIASHLKILAYDDQTLSALGKPSLNAMEWAQLLQNLSAQEPQAILIDGLMSFPPSADDEAQGWQGLVQHMKTPIYAGAHVSPYVIAGRQPADLSAPAYQLPHYLAGAGVENTPPLQMKEGWKVFGHAPAYQDMIWAIGHISYNQDGTIAPIYSLGNNTVLPHLSLYAAPSIAMADQHLLINDNAVPLSQAGTVRINHRPPLMFYKNKMTTSLHHALKRAQSGKPETRIQKGDVVLILPNFATGNTDYHEATPFGEVPGGFIVAAMVDSVVAQRWIKAPEWDNVLMVVFGAIGLIWGLQSTALWFWVGSLVFTVMVVVASMLSFSLYAVSFPWFFPLMAYHGLGLINFTHRRFEEELKKISLEKTYFAEKAMRLEEENKMIKLEESLKLGKAVQQLLMPKYLQGDFSTLHYEMKHIPSQTMAGDWFYIWDVDDSEKRIFMGDVMGKGPSAALPVAVIISTLRECQDRQLTIMETVHVLNKRLVDLFGGAVTSSISAITLRSNLQVDILCGGTPGWFLHEPGKPVQLFPLRGNPLGLRSNIQVEHRMIPLAKDAVVFTFTDGYLEGPRAVKRLARRLNSAEININDAAGLHTLLTSITSDSPWDDDKSLLSVHAA